ncbi:hypothetical protein BGW38_007830 [Lunasporangiospora selenospora]|uniref:Uncharacterized protein n=1 Tax=Lunasporangiospora selenospora TaxID=979761 RepID=A0A9P6FY48_9FUNG|nr:hypothetical protein BGW38_007830 [Lunasporangiospora selenospora]
MVQSTPCLTPPRGSRMFIRRSDRGSEIELDNRGWIGLQVRQKQGHRDCCRRDRLYRKSFDDYIYSQGRWFIYFDYAKMGKVHLFLNFNMVHESRMDEPIIGGRQKDGIYLSSWSQSLVSFFEEFIKEDTDHFHINLYYPKETKGGDEESETSSINHSDLNQVSDQVPNLTLEQSPNQDSGSDSNQDSDQGPGDGSGQGSDKDFDSIHRLEKDIASINIKK